jgi:trimethylamine:corrinoid methyltransferase-like protein
VQLLLDIEMVRYFKHVVEGFEFSEDAFCMDAIAEVGPSGSFLSHPTTLFNHQSVLWDSHLWTTDSVGTWQANGAPTFLDKAKAEIEALIKKHDYHLPDNEARELDKLCKEAEAVLLGKK